MQQYSRESVSSFLDRDPDGYGLMVIVFFAGFLFVGLLMRLGEENE